MAKIGVIINPAAGRDIRRIVGDAEYVTLFSKVSVAKRFIIGLDSVDTYEILIMPDNYGIAEAVVQDLRGKIRSSLSLIDLEPVGDVSDTIRAASILSRENVRVIVSFGGDGTLRAVFKGSGVMPIVGVPLGTNNVLSRVAYDPTVLGVLLGLTLSNIIPANRVFIQMKTLKLLVNNVFRDIALIDMAFVEGGLIGSRAIWDLSNVRFIAYSKCEPTDIGLASIGGNISPTSIEDDRGLLVKLSNSVSGYSVRAVIAPGLVVLLKIDSYEKIPLNTSITIPRGVYVVAFDGERELVVSDSDEIKILLERSGPLIFDPNKALSYLRESLDSMSLRKFNRQGEA